jgi:hypothetical protein
VTPIQGDDQIGLKPFGEGDHRGIGAAERKVSIPIDEVGDPRPVLWTRSLDVKTFETSKETGFQMIGSQKVHHLGHTEGRDHQMEPGSFQSREGSMVGWIRTVGGGDQRAAIHDRG